MPAHRRPYTEADHEIMRAAPPETRMQDLARRLRRPVKSLRKEARALGLKFIRPKPPNTLKPGGRSERILAVLAEGPATAGEVAAALEVSTKLAFGYLAQLKGRGLLRRRRGAFGTCRYVWELVQQVGP